jgi:hypothetical protein
MNFLRVFHTSAVALLCAIPILATNHDAMNGTWKLIPASSDFAGQPVVQTGTVTIRVQDRVIIVERSFMYEGANETYFYSDVSGANNGATIHSGKDLTSKTKWDHNVLQVTTTLNGAVTIERYHLAGDGTMMVNVERPGHKPIELAFRRQ